MTGGFDYAGHYNPANDPTRPSDPAGTLNTLMKRQALTFARDLMLEDLRTLQADAQNRSIGTASVSKALEYALFTGATKYLERRIKDLEEQLEKL